VRKRWRQRHAAGHEQGQGAARKRLASGLAAQLRHKLGAGSALFARKRRSPANPLF